MSLKSHLPEFRQQVKDSFDKHAKAAFKASFKQSLIEGHSIEDAAELVARNFSHEFAKIADDLSEAISKHIESALLVATLSNSAGAVTGKIKVT